MTSPLDGPLFQFIVVSAIQNLAGSKIPQLQLMSTGSLRRRVMGVVESPSLGGSVAALSIFLHVSILLWSKTKTVILTVLVVSIVSLCM